MESLNPNFETVNEIKLFGIKVAFDLMLFSLLGALVF